MRLFRNAFFWEWSTAANGIAVRSEASRVFAKKSPSAAQTQDQGDLVKRRKVGERDWRSWALGNTLIVLFLVQLL
jgi:hypothetical protein